MKPKEVKFGIIGTGHRGQGLIRNYLSIKGCKITALCDRHEQVVKQAYDIVGDRNAACYTDHRKLLKEAKVDAVCIFTEPELNVPLACEALAAGKHAMCEVPLCYTLDDCWRIILAVEKTVLKFQMAEQVRYSPHIQAWRKLVTEGRLGKIIFVRGEYLHPLPDDWYWVDSKTGEKIPLAQAAQHPHKKKGRIWTLTHPIWYLPHELSPLLSVLDDRVKRVTCMSTRRKSYRHEWFDHPDIEVASMHTEKDTIMELAAGFTCPNYVKPGCGYHWYQVMGMKGSVETSRAPQDKMKMWLADSFMNAPADINWEFNPHETPVEAMTSGHGGLDYYPMASFIKSILEDTPPPMDVYKAVESAAPAILAGTSAENGSKCLEVPDFRPGKRRKPGQMPA